MMARERGVCEVPGCGKPQVLNYTKKSGMRIYRRICNAHHRSKYPVSSEAQRRWYLKKKYGLSLEDFQIMFDIQGGVCAICGEAEVKQLLSVDHDHKTDKVRGLLCHLCNTGLGYFRDRPDLLSKAQRYLKEA